MHVIPNNILAMEKCSFGSVFSFVRCVPCLYHRVTATVQHAASTPQSHLSGPIINYVPNRNVVHYRSWAGNRYKCQSTERDQ